MSIIYLVLACLVYAPIGPFDGRHLVTCVCGDSVQEPWFLRWTTFAIARGHNPLFTDYLNVPHGANLAVNTSMPLLGFLGWPVTEALNGVATYNLLLRLGFALSALSMYLVMRRYVTWRPAAFTAGLFFGFSPHMVAQGRAHMFLMFLPLVPLFVPLVDDWLVRPTRSAVRSGLYVGLVAGVQMLISIEVLVLAILCIAVGLAAIAVRFHSDVRQRLPLLARGLPVAAGVTAILSAALVWMYFFGAQHLNGPPHAVSNLDTYHGDLLSPLLPSRAQLIAPGSETADRFVRGSLEENGLYLGLPLVALAVATTVWLRRHALVIAAAASGIVAFVLSLGTSLTVANHATHVPLPTRLLTHIPVLQEIEPARFALITQFAAAVLFGIGIDRLRQTRSIGRPVIATIAASTAAVLTLVAAAPRLPLPSARTNAPAYFSSDEVRRLPPRTIALTFPYEYLTSNDAMLWQLTSDMRFRLFGGEAYVPGPNGVAKDWPLPPLPVVLRYVFLLNRHWQHYAATTNPGDITGALRTFLHEQNVRAVFVRTTSPQGLWVSSVVTAALGHPPQHTPGLDVWSS